jgi:hypothetical protein
MTACLLTDFSSFSLQVSGILFVRLELRFLAEGDWIWASRKIVSVQCHWGVKCEDCATWRKGAHRVFLQAQARTGSCNKCPLQL